jgi:serine O-acetyltransferase
MRGLVDNASSQEAQIALLWQAIEKLSESQSRPDCVPDNAAVHARFEGKKIADLLGK